MEVKSNYLKYDDKKLNFICLQYIQKVQINHLMMSYFIFFSQVTFLSFYTHVWIIVKWGEWWGKEKKNSNF